MADERCPECGGYRGLPRMLHDQDVPRECSDQFHSAPEAPEVLQFPSPAAEAQPQPAAQDPLADSAANAAPAGLKLPPICPYCSVEGKIVGAFTNLGPMQVCVVRCGNPDCRKILSIFQPLNLEMMAPPGMPGFKH